jgi:hypothetical protein
MVFRKAYDTVNRVGRAWDNFNQRTYNTLSRPDRREQSATILLAEVVADWPVGTPDTPAVTAARAYLRRNVSGA